jgi:hypothetical protein
LGAELVEVTVARVEERRRPPWIIAVDLARFIFYKFLYLCFYGFSFYSLGYCFSSSFVFFF